MANDGFKLNTNFVACAIFTMLSVISFFQINSYWADKNNFNGIFGWLGIGIVLAIVAIYWLYRTIKSSTGTGG